MWRRLSSRGTLVSILWLAGIIPQSAFAQDVLLRSPLNPALVINHYNLDPVYAGPTMSAPPPIARDEEEYKTPLQTMTEIGMGP